MRMPTILCILILTVFYSSNAVSQEQNPMTMNGGSILAMAGKDCVALAVDKRFANGNQMVNIAPRHVFVPSPQLIIAFTGLEGDAQSLSQELSRQVSSKLGRGLGFLSENRRKRRAISPRAMASLTRHVLYNRRQAPYFVQPLVVGLTEAKRKAPNGKPCFVPYLCSLDSIGAKSASNSFVCAGAASNSLLGTAEASWRPDLTQDELVQVCCSAFFSALERDCLSGYGAILYLVTADGILEYDLASRND